MKIRIRIALLTMTAAIASLGLPSASAGATEASCPARETTQAFAPMLDPISYFRLPDGDFEHGQGGWTFGGGTFIESGANQTLLPASSSDSHDLVLPAGGRARAATLCVDGTATVMRLFAKPRSFLGSALTVTVTATNDAGASLTLLSPVIPLLPGWSAPQQLFRLPLLADGFTQVTIEIRSVGLGAVAIDDIWVDPLRQK